MGIRDRGPIGSWLHYSVQLWDNGFSETVQLLCLVGRASGTSAIARQSPAFVLAMDAVGWRTSRIVDEEGEAVVRRRSEVEKCGSVEAKRPRREAEQLTIKSEPQPQQEVGLEVLQARCLAPNLGKF